MISFLLCAVMLLSACPAAHAEDVASGTPDALPPVLNSITLSATTVQAPGTIEVIVDASDDVSGLDWGTVVFECEETQKEIYCELSTTYWDSTVYEEIPYEDGKLHGTLKIDQYVPDGTFVIDTISLYDVAGNSAWYSRNKVNTGTPDPFHPVMPESVKSLELKVLNAVPDVTTSVAKPEFVEQVEQAADNAHIVADYSGNAVLTEEAFEAIAGTDKTLDLVSEGVTWRFNGEDIVNEPKPIDLSVQISTAEEETSSTGQEIQEALDETPAVVMKFAENGQLPGKATIQVKVDYAMREYLGTDRKLCVYYYNNQTGQLELIAKDLMVISDTYVEFSITHCSYYVLTTEIELPCAHDMQETAAAVAATCETAGKTAVMTCSLCGLVEGGEEIEALGHNMQEVPAAEPTCTAAGHAAGMACANGCGKTEGCEEIPAKGHSMVDGVCSVCGYGSVALGDANGDGKVNLRDAILVLQAANGKDVAVDEVAADVTGDGKMNIRDAILILKRANGNPDPFPAEK